MNVDLTTEEMLALTSGPIVAGRDVIHAATSAQAKLFRAIEKDGKLTKDGHWTAPRG